MQQRIEEDYNDEIMEDIETAGEFIEPAKAYIVYILTLMPR